MATKTASPYRTSSYTNVKKCDGCGRAFWTRSDWNRVSVKCPHCSRVH